jgi:uncharacterized protein involved in cysteine biosynthesis
LQPFYREKMSTKERDRKKAKDASSIKAYLLLIPLVGLLVCPWAALADRL